MGYTQRLRTKLKGQYGDDVPEPGTNKAANEPPQRRETERETKTVNGLNLVEIPKPKGFYPIQHYVISVV
jgi:cytochrome P450/NADPH-cytochrome P450 reductase